MSELLTEISNNSIVKLVYLAVLADVVFGVLRSAKQHNFNSSFGIDGLIRKCAVLIAMIFLIVADTVTNLDLMPFVSEQTLKPINLTSIGLTEVFGMLFTAFETLSVLKNMMLLGLPLPKGLKSRLEQWIKENSDEMGDKN